MRPGPMSAPAEGSAPPVRSDWTRAPRGRASPPPLWAQALASGARVGVARAPPAGPLAPSRPASLWLSSCAPGSGRALAGLRIAHSGGAAVFVGWGSGLPLVAGIRAQPR